MRVRGIQSLHQAQDNKQFDNGGDSIGWIAQSRKNRLVTIGVTALIVAPALALSLIGKTTKAQENQTQASANLSNSDEFINVEANSNIVTGGNSSQSDSGSTVQLNIQSTSTSSSNPSENKSTINATVNGEPVQTDNNGTIHKTIHSSGPNASVNVSIDSQNSSEGEESGGSL